MEKTERTIILYHGNCPDGFGGAYAAWKKFGDEAEYVPLRYGKPVPEGLTGAHLYFVDFCYEKEVMDSIVSQAASVMVLDHHLGIKGVAESMPSYVFDHNHSGATIAWKYFHPDTPVPPLLEFVEDDDIYRFALPDTRAVLAYLITQPFEFEVWDAIITDFKDDELRQTFFVKARTCLDYFNFLIQFSADNAKLVEFEGYRCYFATSHHLITIRSAVANLLYKKLPPIALVVSAHPEGFGVSIRSDGSVDVSAIARKYGGNGHPGSSGFSIPNGSEMPWKLIDEAHEDPRG